MSSCSAKLLEHFAPVPTQHSKNLRREMLGIIVPKVTATGLELKVKWPGLVAEWFGWGG